MEEEADCAGRPPDSAGDTGQESEVLLVLTFFVASAGLCASAAFCSQSFVSVDLVSFL